MSVSRTLRLTILSLMLGCTIGCDQTTKYLARAQLGQQNSIVLPVGLGELRLAQNPGSFLSLGASFPQPLRFAFLTVGVALGLLLLLVWLVELARKSWLSFLGLALVMAGGVSNLIDRVTQQGLVTDFIFVRIGPVHTGILNLADSMIMTGITVLTCALWKQRYRLPISTSG